MHRASTLAVAACLLAAPAAVLAQEESRAVADGGIKVEGWSGRIDASETAAGQRLENARFAAMGDGLHVTTGPAVTYWRSDSTLTGRYTVRATFREPQYMNRNSHPHPYGIVVGGSEMGTEGQRFLYCAAYGNGNVIVRGFGPAAFQLNGRRGEAHAAVNKAAGPGQPVEQAIAVHVRDDRVECEINGQVVGSYPKSDVVAEGRLAGTDGMWGLRFGHNTEVMVTGLTVTKE